MESSPIKVWKNVKMRSLSETIIELFPDHIQFYSSPNAKPVKLNAELLLTGIESLVSPAFDAELFSELTKILPEDYFEKMDTLSKLHLLFWKKFSFELLREEEFRSTPRPESPYTLSISKNGAANYFKNYLLSEQRFDNLFFKGPKIPGLSMEDRIEIRNMLFSALSDPKPFEISAAFPIFDYNKVITLSLTVPHNNNGGGEDSLNIYNNGIVTIGGYDRAGGGSNDYSVENIWSEPHLIPALFDRTTVLQALKTGII